jgi:hypothetical protein
MLGIEKVVDPGDLIVFLIKQAIRTAGGVDGSRPTS